LRPTAKAEPNPAAAVSGTTLLEPSTLSFCPLTFKLNSPVSRSLTQNHIRKGPFPALRPARKHEKREFAVNPSSETES